MNYLGRFLGRILGGVITIILVGFAVSLAISNPNDMAIRLWPFDHQLTLPIWLVVLASFGAGLILGGLAMLGSLFTVKMKQFHLKKKIKTLEKEKLELSKQVLDHSSQHSLLGTSASTSNKKGN